MGHHSARVDPVSVVPDKLSAPLAAISARSVCRSSPGRWLTAEAPQTSGSHCGRGRSSHCPTASKSRVSSAANQVRASNRARRCKVASHAQRCARRPTLKFAYINDLCYRQILGASMREEMHGIPSVEMGGKIMAPRLSSDCSLTRAKIAEGAEMPSASVSPQLAGLSRSGFIAFAVKALGRLWRLTTAGPTLVASRLECTHAISCRPGFGFGK